MRAMRGSSWGQGAKASGVGQSPASGRGGVAAAKARRGHGERAASAAVKANAGKFGGARAARAKRRVIGGGCGEGATTTRAGRHREQATATARAGDCDSGALSESVCSEGAATENTVCGRWERGAS